MIMPILSCRPLHALIILALAARSPAQETWSFDHGSEAVTVAADGSFQVGGDSLQFTLGANGVVTVAGAGIDFSVSAGEDLLVGSTGTPDHAALRLLTRRPSSLVPADLAGTWKYMEFEIEEGAGGPALHGFATSAIDIGVQADGTVQIGGAPAGSFVIDAAKHVVVTVDGQVIDFGITAAKDVMVSTSSEAGFHYLRLMMRPESGGATSQLAGPWSLAALTVNAETGGSEFRFDAADVTISAAGTFTFPGESTPVTLAAGGSGAVTGNDNGETFGLVWSQSRDLLALARTTDPEHELAMLVRRSGSLALADLAGTWDLHELSIENPFFTDTTAETYFPDGTVQERFAFVESDNGDRLRDGLATTYWQGTGLPHSEATWAADVMAGTSVRHGLTRFFDTDGTTVVRTENYVDDQLDGQPAVREWNTDGQLTLSEDWSAGVITRSVQRAFDGAGDPNPFMVTTTVFTAGQPATQLIESYHNGTANLWLVNSLTFTEGVITRSETTTYQEDGATRIEESLTVTTTAGVVIEQSSRQYLADGVGLSSTIFSSFQPDGTPVTRITASYHPDGATVQYRTTTTYPEGATHVLYETFLDTGARWNEQLTIDGVLIRHTQWHANGNTQEIENYTYPEGVTTIVTERFYDTGTRQYEGTTVGGLADGIVTTWHPNGMLASRTVYTLGQRDGLDETFDTAERPLSAALYALDVLLEYTSTSYHPSGQKATESRTDFAGGVQTRVWRTWTAGGVLTSESRTVNWQPDGVQRHFDSQGRPTSLQTYANGVLDGAYSAWFDDSTQIQVQGTYVDGKRDGLWTNFHANGQVASRQAYSNDLPDGEEVTFDAEARPTASRTWVRGKLRRNEDWYYHANGVLAHHSVLTRSSGDLNGDVAESAVTETWDEEGLMESYSEYALGRPHGESRSYRNGILTSRAHHVRGLLEGLREQFFFDWSNPDNPANGNPVSAQEYVAGKLDGLSLHYNFENGWLLERARYRRGKLHGLREQFFDVNGSATPGSPRSTGEFIDGLRNGLHTTWSTPGVLSRQETYLEDVLNGPWSSHHGNGQVLEEGQYSAGLKSGWWTRYSSDGTRIDRAHYRAGFYDGIVESGPAGRINQRASYLNGVPHGLWEYFGSSGNTHYRSHTTQYSHGEETGPRRYYFSDGRLQRIEPLVLGRIEGTMTTYYADGGGIESTTTYVSGVPHGEAIEYFYGTADRRYVYNYHGGVRHGAYRQYSYRGQPLQHYLAIIGSYSNGIACGTWTYYYSDGSSYSTESGPCTPAPDPSFRVTRGIEGIISLDGDPLPFAPVSLILASGTAGTATTALDGSYRIEFSSTVTDTEATLRVSLLNAPTTEVAVTIPYQDGFVTRNIDLSSYDAPIVTLGTPSVAGLFFLEDVDLAVDFPNAGVDWRGSGAGPVRWQQGRDEDTFSNSIVPGLDLDPAGGPAEVVATNAAGRESAPVPLPEYKIYPQPDWTPGSRGSWFVESAPFDGSPATYRYKTAWPEEPVNLGINEEALGTPLWLAWSSLPVIGDELGLFDVQFELDAKAHTDGTGELQFGGQGEVKAAGKSVRLEADGEGDLLWGGSLEISRASVALDGIITIDEAASALSLFPALEPLQELPAVGDVISGLNSLASLKFTVEGGVGGRFPIDTANGEILFSPTELRLQGISTAEGRFNFLSLATLDASISGRLLGTWDLTGEEVRLKDFTYTATAKATATLDDFMWSDERVDVISFPAAPGPALESLEPSVTGPVFRLVEPDFLEHGGYAHFLPPQAAAFGAGPGAGFPTPVAQTLLGNCYPLADPVVAEHNGTRVIAYIHFDPARPAGQSTRLYYTIDTGAGFSAPAPVHAEARADFTPQLSFLDDGRLVAVWKTSRLGQVATTIEERLAGLEIAWAVYDPGTSTWSAPALLSDNTHLDHSPLLASSPQGPMLVWQGNAGNALVGTATSPTTVHCATWTGSGFAAPSPLPAGVQPGGLSSLAYDGTDALFTWIRDEDGDLTTAEDRELYWSQFDGASWGAPVRVTADGVVDRAPRVFCLANDSFELVWIKGTDLVRMADFGTRTHELLRASSPTAPPPQYDITCDALGRIALLWTDTTAAQTDLRYALFDPLTGTWSSELLLTDNNGSEKSPTFSLRGDGVLFAVFLREDVDTTRHDLLWLERSLGQDLTVGPVTVDPDSSPDQFHITAEFRNLGELSVGNAAVDFHLGDPDAGGTLLGSSTVTLAGGSVCEASITTSGLPAGADGTIHVRIDPADLIVESDETNNVATTALSPVDLVAADLRWELSADGFTLHLTGSVHNKGRTTQTDIPVRIEGEQGSLLSNTIPSLPPGARVDILGSLATAMAFPADDNVFSLVVDPDDTLGEPDRDDNVFTLPISLREPAAFAPTDSDGDGLEDTWELTHFGTLTRDGTGDFDGDSRSDLLEALTGTDPRDPNSQFVSSIDPDPGRPGDVLVTIPPNEGTLFRIQRAPNMVDWADYSLHLGGLEPLVIPVAGLDTPECFFRIQVEAE